MMCMPVYDLHFNNRTNQTKGDKYIAFFCIQRIDTKAKNGNYRQMSAKIGNDR